MEADLSTLGVARWRYPISPPSPDLHIFNPVKFPQKRGGFFDFWAA